jgi:hypothetical protein
VASLKRDIVFRFLGDASKLQAAARQAEQSLTSVSSKMQNAGAKLSSFGASMTRSLTIPIVAAGGAAIKFAIDTEESLSKVGAVFGNNATDIDEWSKGLADNFRVSRRQALEAAGNFGNLFVAMGLGQDEAAGMSQRMVELAGDLSSFNNIPVDQALEKLRSGLVGEIEPLRQLGVSFNAAMVEAKALEMGLVDLEGNVTEQGKVQARFALIMEQTALAQGDAARTAETAAGQMATARANLDNAMTGLGEVLLPIATDVLTNFVTPLIEDFADLDETTQKWILGIGGGLAAGGPAIRGLGAVLSLLGQIARNPGFSLLLGGIAVWELVLITRGDEIFDWFLQQRDKVNEIPVVGGIKKSLDEKTTEGVTWWAQVADNLFGTDFAGRLEREGGGGPRSMTPGYENWSGPVPSYVNVNVTDWNIWDPNLKYQIGSTVVDAMQNRTQASAGSVGSRYQARAN